MRGTGLRESSSAIFLRASSRCWFSRQSGQSVLVSLVSVDGSGQGPSEKDFSQGKVSVVGWEQCGHLFMSWLHIVWMGGQVGDGLFEIWEK